MKKRDEINDPNSCLNRAREDEPVFTLLGHDVAAPATVRFWAKERIRLAKNRADDAQIKEALKWADESENEVPF